MMMLLQQIPMAILAFFGWLFAAPASVAQDKVGKSGKGGKLGDFNFLPVLFVVCIFAVLTACGGSGSGGGGNSNVLGVAPNGQVTITTNIRQGQTPDYYVAWSSAVYVPNSSDSQVAISISDSQRCLRTQQGVNVACIFPRIFVVPGGEEVLTTNTGQPTLRLWRINSTWTAPLATVGAVVGQTVYVADFSRHQCDNVLFRLPITGDNNRARAWEVTCVRTVISGFMSVATATVHKTQRQILRVCWQDVDDSGVRCPQFSEWGFYMNGMGVTVTGRINPALAFPDQSYRRDNGKCESAPFYAVGNCQGENAVDVGNFAAFVSGLDGNGYRQFGVRHRFDGEGWKAAAMVSHAKGAEFLDTWWGRLRFEHSIFDDASAFAEYESGITSLQQRGVMFADIPISGGRVGFRFADFTASFGRPMHYKGKGKNAAALHWQATKQTEFSFRSHQGNAEVHYQWRREL